MKRNTALAIFSSALGLTIFMGTPREAATHDSMARSAGDKPRQEMTILAKAADTDDMTLKGIDGQDPTECKHDGNEDPSRPPPEADLEANGKLEVSFFLIGDPLLWFTSEERRPILPAKDKVPDTKCNHKKEDSPPSPPSSAAEGSDDNPKGLNSNTACHRYVYQGGKWVLIHIC